MARSRRSAADNGLSARTLGWDGNVRQDHGAFIVSSLDFRRDLQADAALGHHDWRESKADAELLKLHGDGA